ncbi:hypothetical protein [Photobacterium leiognathi]|uniref:hypothetical protein n=1 Tax=Photobacterium leiognathi TaxID=553611 RepID=UPI002735C89D|nr:hypothetical protein [Photobacterium leiognathi]
MAETAIIAKMAERVSDEIFYFLNGKEEKVVIEIGNVQVRNYIKQRVKHIQVMLYFITNIPI